MKKILSIPHPSLMIRAFRDMGGHSFPQAIAEIVDNSISAGATEIEIDVQFDGEDSWVRIADNGQGMTATEARESLRHGSSREYADDDLGKYGVGLKLASLSQSRRMSLATRRSETVRRISMFAWDCDTVKEDGKWHLMELEPRDTPVHLHMPLRGRPGTVVLLEKLDRVISRAHPSGEVARRHLAQDCRALELHLSMVHHRFMAAEGRRRVAIYLNGNKLAPWDPFCRSEPRTVALDPLGLDIAEAGLAGRLEIHPFVLPRKDDFSSLEAFSIASGPGGWNHSQGLYIERSSRLIQAGGWSGQRARDEHTKLARVSVSFTPSLDELLTVNASKMRVSFPRHLRERIAAHLQPCLRLARETYDRRSSAKTSRPARSASIPSPPPTDPPPAKPPNMGVSTCPAPRLLSRDQWGQEMLLVATEEERPIVAAVLERTFSGKGGS
jgi:hypothetical protein